MNRDIVRSKWAEMSGEIKEHWGKISDYDLTDVNGDPERLLELLHRRYGVSGRWAKEELDDFLGKYLGNSDEDISTV